MQHQQIVEELHNYTTVEGKVVRVPKTFKSVTGVSGIHIGEALDDSKVLIPGTKYSVANST